MNAQIDSLISRQNKGERLKFIFFWGHKASPEGQVTESCFSQWWAEHPFQEEGIPYLTAEHYMMAGKAKLFDDAEVLSQILQCQTPAEAKKLGREVRNFEQAEWEKHRMEIVVQANILKFGQHPDLHAYLMMTGERIIVEASPRDRIWGIGMSKNNEKAYFPAQWRGQNLLGFALMEARKRLRNT